MAITEAAIQLFDQKQQCPRTCTPQARARMDDDCPGCREWWRLHPILRRALREKMWNFPTICREKPDRRHNWASDTPEGRWLALEAASKARREVKRAMATPPSPPPEQPASP